jgi:hypothetical protein
MVLPIIEETGAILGAAVYQVNRMVKTRCAWRILRGQIVPRGTIAALCSAFFSGVRLSRVA